MCACVLAYARSYMEKFEHGFEVTKFVVVHNAILCVGSFVMMVSR